MTKVKLGKYQHYKGKMYEVIGVARQEDTLKELVIYRALYDSKKFGDKAMWARPKNDFLAKVFVESKKVPRFKYIGK